MCGRFTLQTPASTLATLFFQLQMPGLLPRYNIAPTQPILCLRQDPEAQIEAVNLRWGLVPSWATDLNVGARMINARSETVATKPSFRSAFKRRRCLVLADGFYEWKKVGREKRPHYITLSGGEPFAMAGLWETWGDKDDANAKPVESCTVITTEANEFMAPLHDRMPVILDREKQSFWLEREFEGNDALQAVLTPYPSEKMRAVEVSTFVNRAAHESAQCIVPLENGPSAQSLFDF